MCPISIGILGVEIPVVAQVGPFQSNLLGLDSMIQSDMQIHFSRCEFTIAQTPLSLGIHQFNHIQKEWLLNKAGITWHDLVPFEALPPPMQLKGFENIIDLGTS